MKKGENENTFQHEKRVLNINVKINVKTVIYALSENC